MATRQISIRLSVEDADRARAALEALGRSGDAEAGRIAASMTRAGQSVENLSRTVDAAYAGQQRFAQAQVTVTRAVEQGAISQARANELLELARQRYLGVAQASGQATAAINTASNATANAARGYSNVGAAAGQAGFQIQDFTVQVAGGTSAFVAFAQQASQFAGFFGPTGAIIGAALAIGAIAASFLLGKSAAEQLNEALEDQDRLYQDAIKSAADYTDGLSKQATEVQKLIDLYASYTSEQRAYELRRLAEAREPLEEQRARVTRDATRAIRNIGPRVEAFQAIANAGGEELAPNVDAARRALEDFQAAVTTAGGASSSVLIDLASRLAEVAREAGALSEPAARAAKTLDALIPTAQKLDAQLAANQRQVDALSGSTATLAAQTAAAGAAARQAINPFEDFERSIANTNAALAALRSGGLTALADITAQQQDEARATALATQRRREYIQALRDTEGATPEAAERRAAERAAEFEERARQQVAAERTLATERKQEEERQREAEQRRREAEAASRRVATQARREDAKEQREADALVARGVALAATEVDRYADQVRALDAALATGRVTQEAYTEAVARLDPAAKAAAEASKEAAREAEALQRRSADALGRIGESALDRIGTGLVNAFLSGERAALDFGSLAKSVIASVAVDLLKLAVINPFANAVLGGNRETVGGAVASLGVGGATNPSAGGGGFSFDSLSSIFSAGRSAYGTFQNGLGAFDVGSLGILQGTQLAGALNAPIFGAASQAAATNSALAGLGPGVYGPATPGAVSAAGGAGGGLATFGAALGGLGLGIGAGSLVGGLIGNARGTVGPGSMVGSVGGALAGVVIGSLLGGPLIGGLLGGLLGGSGGAFFGPTKKGMEQRSGGAVYFQPNAQGLLEITDANGKRWDEAGSRDAVQQQLDQLNQAVSSRGLFFSREGFDQFAEGQVGFGQAAARAGAPSALNVGGLAGQIRSNDATVNTAVVNAQARGEGLEAILSAADWVQSIYKPLTETRKEVNSFETELASLLETFGSAIYRAKELGLSEEELIRKRDEALQQLEDRRQAQLSSFDESLQIRQLRAANDNLAADLLVFDAQARAEREQINAVFRDLGLEGMETVAYRLVELEETQAQERLAIQQSYADRAIEAERAAAEQKAQLERQAAAEALARDQRARGLLETLTFGGGSALSPEAQGFAALSSLNTARANIGAEGGLDEYVRVAQSTLPVIRDVFGTSERYGAIVADVATTLRGAAPGADTANLAAVLEAQASGSDRLTETVLAVGGDTNNLLGRLLAEMQVLRGNIEALAARAAA